MKAGTRERFSKGHFSQREVSPKEAFSIRFGTDGWRALVAEEFTLPNVRVVVQAIADYLRSHPVAGRRRQVIVGYDTRPLGDRFAEAACEVLTGNGFAVMLTKEPMPTPAVSLAIQKHRLLGGVLLTASHNPFTYNGVKFRPYYAGSAEPAMTRWIESHISRGSVKTVPFAQGLTDHRIHLIDLRPMYLDFLRRYLNWPLLRRFPFRVAYDSMHGSGQNLFEALAQGTRWELIPVRPAGEPVKSSHRPEPVAGELTGLSLLTRKHRCHVGLATDGDADRAGIVDGEGEFISAQETMALLVWHLLEDLGWRGKVVTTVAGTNLLDRIASDYGVPLARTPVGFKHIAKIMRREPVLFGGEESGGFGFRNTVPERDGLLAGLLILQMIAMRRKSLRSILRDLRNRFGRWFCQRGDLVLTRPIDPGRLLSWARSGANLSLTPGGKRTSGGKRRKIDTLDGVKLVFEDDSWLLLRPSGTEPLLRIYAEARTQGAASALIRAGQSVARHIANGARHPC